MNKVEMFGLDFNNRSMWIDMQRASLNDDKDTMLSFWDGENGDNYRKFGSFFTDQFGIEAAEDAFDLSNSPVRTEQRALVQGTASRSLSIGDVVKVIHMNGSNVTDIRFYMCMDVSWEKL